MPETGVDIKGIIVKALAGYYYVKTDQGIYMCRARGIMRKKGVSPLVGDMVLVQIEDEADKEGIVDEVLPRANSFIRPPVANVELFVCVVAAKDPVPNPELMDRLLVNAEASDVPSVICVNKIDLSAKGAKNIEDIYSGVYPVFKVSAKSGEGVDKLLSHIRGRRTAFAGPSGVGKSSLIGLITDAESPEVGEISQKTNRGKHTTRHVELFETESGATLYDTPGYTSFESAEMLPENLAGYFPEISRNADGCKFDNCRHSHEPECSVKAAFDSGMIAEERYRSYIKMLGEAEELLDKY
jgi:ribosome biogenesis GTPase